MAHGDQRRGGTELEEETNAALRKDGVFSSVAPTISDIYLPRHYRVIELHLTSNASTYVVYMYVDHYLVFVTEDFIIAEDLQKIVSGTVAMKVTVEKPVAKQEVECCIPSPVLDVLPNSHKRCAPL